MLTFHTVTPLRIAHAHNTDVLSLDITCTEGVCAQGYILRHLYRD